MGVSGLATCSTLDARSIAGGLPWSQPRGWISSTVAGAGGGLRATPSTRAGGSLPGSPYQQSEQQVGKP